MKKLSDFVKNLSELKSNVSIEFDLSNTNAKKLFYQKIQDRDFGKITKENSSEIVKEIIKEFISGDIVASPEDALSEAMNKGGIKYKEIVLKRFGFGQKDIWLKPLSIAYIKKKGNAKLGINTGELYRDIKNSKILIKEKKK